MSNPPTTAQGACAMPENCGNCLFWDQAQSPNPEVPNLKGFCRRNPPTALALPGAPNGAAVFPITAMTIWCGEHVPAAPAPSAVPSDLN